MAAERVLKDRFICEKTQSYNYIAHAFSSKMEDKCTHTVTR